MAPLRIGILGAAKIAPNALIKPARTVDDVEVVAIAARDRAKAEQFARKHGIGRVHDSYDGLLADPDIDAVYNPLPNGLHGKWTISALEAGKHVLCEKPFTANADEAVEVQHVERRTGLVVMEAFHYRYHPLADRLIEITQDGTLGEIEHIHAWMVTPLLPRNDIRWQLSLAGGSTMDVGCYTIHLVRSLAGAEPDVTKASARERSPGVDRWLQADMTLPDGSTGRITASMLSGRILRLGAEVKGTKGRLRVLNPYAPHYFHRLSVRTTSGKQKQPHFPRVASYEYQLRAFAGAVLRGESIITNTDDAIANMRVIDACYRAAGLEPRQPTA
jgi:predicted dehydrogenase